jgi:hypothetical protein
LHSVLLWWMALRIECQGAVIIRSAPVVRLGGQLSRRMPLNGVPSLLPSMNWPVEPLRLIQDDMRVFLTCVRLTTAPRRNPCPVFFATGTSLILTVHAS